MDNKQKWIPWTILIVTILSLTFSIWTMFLPNHGYGIMSFGVMFPAGLITLTLAVLFATLQED